MSDGPSPAQGVHLDEGWTPPSWEEIVRRHSGAVYRLAYRLAGNQQDAEDITQDVFVRVFRSLHAYRPGSFEGWLHRITTNVFLDLARRRSRYAMFPIGETHERIPSDDPTPEEELERQAVEADLQAALSALPPPFRVVVVLSDVEGLSYNEIATTLGLKIGTVRSRLHRGRTQMRASLQHRAPRGHSHMPSADQPGQPSTAL